MNIGILGGSFDPVHNGHLHMAKCAYQECSLDEVWLIPAGHSPNKDEHAMTSALHRFRMCEIAARQFSWLYVNRLELDSSEVSYTYRTLEKLTGQFPQHHFFFIMGADSLNYFEKWSHPETIAQLCSILVIPRDACSVTELAAKTEDLQMLFPCDIRIISCSQYPVSSTEIRQKLKTDIFDGSDILPEVFSYIKIHHLYGT